MEDRPNESIFNSNIVGLAGVDDGYSKTILFYFKAMACRCRGFEFD